MGTNPFVGPRPFTHKHTLYGRDREIRELLVLISAERLVLLHSPSGAGKSSLIFAKNGLIAKLKEEGFEVLPVIRLNLMPDTPTESLPERFNRYVFSSILSLERVPLIDEQREDTGLAILKLSENELARRSLLSYLKDR